MADVFISYSRKDKSFAARLHEALQARQRETWVDLEDIPPTAEWREKIRTGIEGARAFVFVLSPDSMASPECRKEIEQAATSHKRMIPVVFREVDTQAVPEDLGKLNWIFLRDQDDFEKGVDTLLTAVDTDLEWVDAHTNLLEKAAEWERRDRDKSLLLKGRALAEAEDWQVKSAAKEPKPTELMGQFIQASRQGQKRFQRRLLGSVTFGLVVAVAMAVLAYYQYREADRQFQEADRRGKIALSRQLAAQADKLADSRLDLALLLGAEAVQVEPTFEARDTLHTILATNPQVSKTLMGHNNWLNALAFSGDGQTLASASRDGKILLWDLKTYQTIGKPMEINKFTYSLAFSPDGKILASGDTDIGIQLWDVETQEEVGKLGGFGHEERNDNDRLVFSSDSKRLVAIDSQAIVQWDVTEKKTIGKSISIQKYSAKAVSLDGKTMVWDNKDGTLTVWNLEENQPMGEPLRDVQGGEISRLALSPDGKTLAMGKDIGIIILWDVERRQLIREIFRSHDKSKVTGLEFSHDGKTLASVTRDKMIILWDVENGYQKKETFQGKESFFDALSPDGKIMAFGSGEGLITLWDLKKRNPFGAPLDNARSYIDVLAFYPNGKTLVSISQDNNLRRWDVEKRQELVSQQVLSGTKKHWFKRALSPNGKILAAGSLDGTITLWDVEKGQSRGELMHGQKITVDSLAFSPDGKTLASGGRDKTIILWDVNNHQKIGELREHTGEVTSLAFSPDGNILASGDVDSNLILWNPKTLQPIKKTPAVHKMQVVSTAFSPDGKTLVSSSFAGEIIFWDVEQGKKLGEVWEGEGAGAKATAQALAFSPDSKILATEDTLGITLLDVDTLQKLKMPMGSGGASIIVFSPDGKTLGSNRGGEIMLWQVDPQAWINLACLIVNRNLTLTEWSKYIGDIPYRKTCPSLPGPEEAGKTGTVTK